MINFSGDLFNRLQKNKERLESEMYSNPQVFQPKEYEWQGDFEGRAILALVSLWKATGEKPKNLDEIMINLKDKLNENYYFGKIFDGKIAHEQHLSGHSWFMRGITEYYLMTNDDFCLKIIKSVQDTYFSKLGDFYETYPIIREHNETGGVSGNVLTSQMNNWVLSTDIGCAFIALDGLTAIYDITKDKKLGEVIDIAINKFSEIDKLELRCQTHASLSASRGILRFYKSTNNVKYLEIVKKEYDCYMENGITKTYANFNWYNRKNTWTEPCAICDSLILSLELYKISEDSSYLKNAYRIYYNALSMSQRENGGAGCDLCTTNESPVISPYLPSYEAYFCCSMRLSEGLFELSQNFVTAKDDMLTVNFYDGFNYLEDGLNIKVEGNLFFDKKLKLEINSDSHKNIQLYMPSYIEIKFYKGMDFKRKGEFIIIEKANGIIEIELEIKTLEENGNLFYGDLILCNAPSNIDEILEYEKDIIMLDINGKKTVNLIKLINLPKGISNTISYTLLRL